MSAGKRLDRTRNQSPTGLKHRDKCKLERARAMKKAIRAAGSSGMPCIFAALATDAKKEAKRYRHSYLFICKRRKPAPAVVRLAPENKQVV